MKNNYYLMRHGRSEANIAGRIVSSVEEGVPKWGLSEEGRTFLIEKLGTASPMTGAVIYHSDFKRAAETARLAAELLKIDCLVETPLLRERFFGIYDGGEDSSYPLVWEKDKGNENNISGGVESPRQVSDRFASLIEKIEKDHSGADIILVSHGDTLQIGQTFFAALSPASHRSLKHLETGEIRKIENRN